MRRLAFTLGMGIIMGEALAGSAPAIYLLDMAFREAGTTLIAGRSPVYGMELPNIENTPDSAPKKVIRYALAPIPLRFAEAVYTSDFHFELFPSVAGKACTVDFKLTMTSSPAALRDWIGRGIPEHWASRAWTTELASPAPKTIKAVMAHYSGSGLTNRVVVDSVDLLPEQPAHLRLALPMPAGTTKVSLEVADLRFWLGLDLVDPGNTLWPRGTPAALAERSTPIEAAQPKKKTSAWKFWQREG